MKTKVINMMSKFIFNENFQYFSKISKLNSNFFIYLFRIFFNTIPIIKNNKLSDSKIEKLNGLL